MPVSEPSWWYGERGAWQARLLSPLAAIVGAIASRRIRKATPYRSALPVICVGNFTAGGSGKTPIALLVGRLVAAEGRQPWFLSRGYGGKLQGPVRVDLERHTAQDVGDEPLLLARAFPTVVARDRRKGAAAIEELAQGPAVIIMDDGMQNPSLAKDLVIAAVDARRGLGNGKVIPAGPLRAPLDVQAKLVDLVVTTGPGAPESVPALQAIRSIKDVRAIAAETRPAGDAARLRGRKVIAFAGIANPERFFSALASLGADVVARRSFADHHPFSDAEAQELLVQADRLRATLVTTEKDLARLAGASGVCGDLKRRSEALAVEMAIEGKSLEDLRAAIVRALALKPVAPVSGG